VSSRQGPRHELRRRVTDPTLPRLSITAACLFLHTVLLAIAISTLLPMPSSTPGAKFDILKPASLAGPWVFYALAQLAAWRLPRRVRIGVAVFEAIGLLLVQVGILFWATATL